MRAEPYSIDKRSKTLARSHEKTIKLVEEKLVLAEQKIKEMSDKVKILEEEKVK